MRPATIFLGIWRRGDGLARAEEGSGEESARASAFLFEKIGGYYNDCRNSDIFSLASFGAFSKFVFTSSINQSRISSGYKSNCGRRLFFFLFEDRLTYTKADGYRTADSLSTTRLFEEFSDENSADVDRAGIEPATSALQMRHSSH